MLSHVSSPAASFETSQVFDDFRRLTELNTFIEDHYFTGAAPYQRDELVAEISSRLVGQQICVVELPEAKQQRDRPIEILGVHNSLQLESFRPKDRLRPHPVTSRLYVERDLFPYRKRSSGRVEGVDGERACLVIKNKRFLNLGDRDWVHVVNAEGNPLVEITIDD